MFQLPELPYDVTALEPYISAKTIEFHYGKHHQGYVDNLNKLIKDTVYENMDLEEIIRQTAGKNELGAIFNNAAQAWNHNFFWHSMRSNGGTVTNKELESKIVKDFGSVENFKAEFKNTALTQFGSGWAWLVEDNGVLKVMKTANADTPIAHGVKPILTIDVWEHAYYLDYQNQRASFVEAYLQHLMNI